MKSPTGTTARVTRRAFSVAVLGCVLPAVAGANQAQPRPLRRIGLLVGDDPEGGVAAFKQTLRELGYVEGRNLVIEMRGTVNPPPGPTPPRNWRG